MGKDTLNYNTFVCGKCEQEKGGYGGDTIPEHTRWCPKSPHPNCLDMEGDCLWNRLDCPKLQGEALATPAQEDEK